MSNIHYSSDEGIITTHSAVPATIVCFQTLPDCMGHFTAKVNAISNGGYVKAWQISVRFRRSGSNVPSLSTPIVLLEDGDPEASAWAINPIADADGLICLWCSGSASHTTWVGKFDAIETCMENH